MTLFPLFIRSDATQLSSSFHSIINNKLFLHFQRLLEKRSRIVSPEFLQNRSIAGIYDCRQLVSFVIAGDWYRVKWPPRGGPIISRVAGVYRIKREWKKIIAPISQSILTIRHTAGHWEPVDDESDNRPSFGRLGVRLQAPLPRSIHPSMPVTYFADPETQWTCSRECQASIPRARNV